MKKLLIILIIFCSSCLAKEDRLRTIEVTYMDGQKETFEYQCAKGAWIGLGNKGCLEILGYAPLRCYVRSFKILHEIEL